MFYYSILRGDISRVEKQHIAFPTMLPPLYSCAVPAIADIPSANVLMHMGKKYLISV